MPQGAADREALHNVEHAGRTALAEMRRLLGALRRARELGALTIGFANNVDAPVANEAEWTAEYQRRVGAVMDQLTEGGRTLIWVGIPNDDNPDVTARMAIQDQAAKAAAAGSRLIRTPKTDGASDRSATSSQE